MESLIRNCDFSGIDDSTEIEFRRKLDKNREELSAMKCDGILEILKSFQNKVCVGEFPTVHSQGVEVAKFILKIVLQTLSEKLQENIFSSQEVKDGLLSLYVELFKSGPGTGHCELLHLITETFQFQNPKMFEAWAVTAIEILKDAPKEDTAVDMLAYTSDQFISHLKPRDDLAKLWLTVITGFCGLVHKRGIEAAEKILCKDKWKRCWKWKENVSLAREMIVALTRADYTSSEDVEDYSSKAGSFLEKLIDQLTLMKVATHVEVEVAELAMVTMEAFGKGIEVDRLCRSASEKISLKNNKQLIKDYLNRFLCLLKNEEFDWDGGDIMSAGDKFIKQLIQSSGGSEVRDMDMDDAFLQVFLFCLSEDREYISIEKGGLNIFGVIASGRLFEFVSLHEESNTVSRLEPLFPHIQRLKNEEDDTIQTSMENVISLIEMANLMNNPGMALAGNWKNFMNPHQGIEDLIALYLRDGASETLDNLSSAYVRHSNALTTQFLPLIETFIHTTHTGQMGTQISFLKKVAERQPEVFTKDVLDLIFKHHFMNKKSRFEVITLLEKVSESCAENLEPFMENYLLKTELMMDLKAQSLLPDEPFFENMETYLEGYLPKPKEMMDCVAHFQFRILIRIAAKYQNKQEIICSYLMKRLKESNDEQTGTLSAAIQSLDEMYSMYGAGIFCQKDKEYLEELKNKGPNNVIRNLAEGLFNKLEGRSLEKVSKHVEEHSGQIENLEIGVAGTKVVLKKVHRDVKQQGKDIEGVQQGLGEVNTRVDHVEVDVKETKEKVEEVDKKTMSNAPTWSRDVTKLLNPNSEHDWRLLASRLGYSPDDIRGWATQSDPCMALLSEWYATHKTFEASRGVLNILQEMNRLDAAIIVENAMKAAEGVVADEPVDYPEPPEIFLSYQWGHQNEVKLISRHLEMAGYKCWMDIGQMGGGNKLFEKIDSGIRAAKVVISCVTEKYAKSPNCNREVNLSVNLGKPMIPLLMEKMAWPPSGSMGPIFSEYLFIRFFQRQGEETSDDRIWPAAKFTELLMQLNCLKVMPDEGNISEMYKNWWIPVVEEIVIPKRNEKKGENQALSSSQKKEETRVVSPDVFISYQWGKQKEIMALYQRLTGLGFTCWLDIRQMGGGDSLYDKIDRGVRGCKVMLSSVTTKYALSANCRREVSLADALKKPIIPLLMEKIDWPPSGPMSMVLTQLLYVNFSKDESIQLSWEGKPFDELLHKMNQHVPEYEEIGITDEKKESGRNQEKDSNTEILDSNSGNQKQTVSEQDMEKPSYPKKNEIIVETEKSKISSPKHETRNDTQSDEKKKSSTCCIL